MKFFTTRFRTSDCFCARFIFQQHGAECRIAHPESAESAAAESAADRENLAHSICDFPNTDAAKDHLQSLGVKNIGKIQLDPQNQISLFKSKTRSTALEGLENIDDRLAGVEGVRTVLFKGGVLYEIRSLAEDGLGNPESIDSRLENKKIQSLIFKPDGSLSYKDTEANNHKLPAPENTDVAAESAPAEGEAAPTAADSADSGSAAAVSAPAPRVSAPAAPTAGAEEATIAGETHERLDLSGVTLEVENPEIGFGEVTRVMLKNLPARAKMLGVSNLELTELPIVDVSVSFRDASLVKIKNDPRNVPGTYSLVATVGEESNPANRREIPFQITIKESNESEIYDLSQVSVENVVVQGRKASFEIHNAPEDKVFIKQDITVGGANIFDVAKGGSVKLDTQSESGKIKVEFQFKDDFEDGNYPVVIPIAEYGNASNKRNIEFDLNLEAGN